MQDRELLTHCESGCAELTSVRLQSLLPWTHCLWPTPWGFWDSDSVASLSKQTHKPREAPLAMPKAWFPSCSAPCPGDRTGKHGYRKQNCLGPFHPFQYSAEH